MASACHRSEEAAAPEVMKVEKVAAVVACTGRYHRRNSPADRSSRLESRCNRSQEESKIRH